MSVNKGFRLTLSVLTVLSLTFALVSHASAQATRTWVSGVGDDANPCSRTAPCKTFAGAISKTATSGEIDCLDPGGFGAVTITKSLTIDCDAGTGGILASGATGVFIVGAGIDVNLRNLTIQGSGTGVAAINIANANNVHLEDVIMSGFTSECILLSSGAVINLTVHDSTMTECVTGIRANNGSRITVDASRFMHNTVGIDQNGLSGGGSTVMVTGSTFANNDTALQSAAGAFIGASGNTFTNQNITIYNLNGGQIFTGNDNPTFGNAAIGATTGALAKG
jgi:hypothetical protein